jgi:hypothetical protein
LNANASDGRKNGRASNAGTVDGSFVKKALETEADREERPLVLILRPKSHFCIVNNKAQIMARRLLLRTAAAFRRESDLLPRSLIAIEVLKLPF